MLFGMVFFLVSAVFTFSEVKYFIWGKTAECSILGVEQVESTHRRGRIFSSPKQRVRYSFVDASGASRTGTDEVGLGFHVPAGRGEVVYLKNMSQLSGNSNVLMVCYFFGSLAFVIGTLISYGIEAKRPFKPTVSRRKPRQNRRSLASR
ncbi:hypothetical protein SH668x_001365 [Planctomicrobium sp. SH668]|uniref:hypothetical protein n=1 Tax=Planctomicrobium sp. SH668 TaxID=3448126 RepID=UPI003F5C5871